MYNFKANYIYHPAGRETETERDREPNKHDKGNMYTSQMKFELKPKLRAKERNLS